MLFFVSLYPSVLSGPSKATTKVHSTAINSCFKTICKIGVSDLALSGHATDTPAYRRVGQTVLDKATTMNSGVEVTDSQSGFRAFAASTVNIFRFKADGMAIESEMLADAGKAGLRIKEVDIGVRYDVDCSTEHPLRHGLGVLVKILKDMEFNRPLYYFTIPGIVMGGVGAYMGLSFLQTFYFGGALNFGPTMLMILLTLIGTFMAFTGIMLHSMARLITASNLR